MFMARRADGVLQVDPNDVNARHAVRELVRATKYVGMSAATQKHLVNALRSAVTRGARTMPDFEDLVADLKRLSTHEVKQAPESSAEAREVAQKTPKSIEL